MTGAEMLARVGSMSLFASRLTLTTPGDAFLTQRDRLHHACLTETMATDALASAVNCQSRRALT
jgi:hypothetical protein